MPPTNDAFGFWIRTLVIVNSMSLIVDIIDVVRFAAGERKELVPGL